jgi:hypothetical protein
MDLPYLRFVVDDVRQVVLRKWYGWRCKKEMKMRTKTEGKAEDEAHYLDGSRRARTKHKVNAQDLFDAVWHHHQSLKIASIIASHIAGPRAVVLS